MAEQIDSIRLALFGESNAGKSHYGGQLLSRIEAETCELRLRDAPTDLSPFEEVRTRLNAGLPAAHTSSGVYRESIWPVKSRIGNKFDLTWPDYAGEQVRQLIETRRIGQAWLDRVQSADGWILMVRASLAKPDEDIFSKPLKDVAGPEAAVDGQPRRSNQARLVELLQMLLHARGLHGAREFPSLVILMSCWDELHLAEGARPDAQLKASLPLLSSYVKCRWGENKAAVFGLSALESPLDVNKPNEDFVNRGPEQFGYVITPEGNKTSDLTLPIVCVAEMAKR